MTNCELTQEQLKQNRFEVKAWMIWCLGALYFFSHYIVRVFPASNSVIFIQEFNATQTQIGLLATCFYLPYLFMQMPAGVLLDRFGCRILLSFAVLCCAVSTFLLSRASSLIDVDISRLVLGIVSGFGFVGAVKLAATWFSPVRLGLVIGLTQALGMLGAAIGTQNMAVYYQEYGWRPTLFNFSLLLVGLSIAIGLFVRNGPLNQTHSKSDTDKPKLMDNIKTVFCHPITWVNALYAGLIFAPIEIIGEVWGGQLIQTIHSTTALEASSITSYVFYGWLIGGPLAGQISSWIGRKPVMIVSALCGTIISAAILFLPFHEVNIMSGICFLLGLTNGGLVASYTVASELHPKYATGLSTGLTNMASVLIAAIMHPLIGMFIDWHWDGQLNDLGNPVYSVSDFQLPFMVMPICAFMAFILSFFMKETFVKKSPS